MGCQTPPWGELRLPTVLLRGCSHMHAHTWMFVHTHACKQMHIPTYPHTHTHATHAHVCMHMHTHAGTQTRAHAHVHPCTPAVPTDPCPAGTHGPRAPRSPLAQPRYIQQVSAGLGAEAGGELKGKAPKPQLGPQTGLMDTRQWR